MSLDEAHGPLLRSTGGRIIAPVVFIAGFFVLMTPVTSPIGILLVLALLMACVALWIRAKRARPEGCPGVRESIPSC